MTDYVPYTPDEYAPDAPGTALHFQRWFENWIAGFEGANGAPRLLAGAHPTFAAGNVQLMNLYGANALWGRSFSSGGTASGVAYGEDMTFSPMKAGGLRVSIEMQNGTGRFQVLKNGTVLTTISGTGTAYQAQTYDFTFALGDAISFKSGVAYSFGSGGGSASCNFRNLQILGDQRGVFRI
jgi:hypothetical protein